MKKLLLVGLLLAIVKGVSAQVDPWLNPKGKGLQPPEVKKPELIQTAKEAVKTKEEIEQERHNKRTEEDQKYSAFLNEMGLSFEYQMSFLKVFQNQTEKNRLFSLKEVSKPKLKGAMGKNGGCAKAEVALFACETTTGVVISVCESKDKSILKIGSSSETFISMEPMKWETLKDSNAKFFYQKGQLTTLFQQNDSYGLSFDSPENYRVHECLSTPTRTIFRK